MPKPMRMLIEVEELAFGKVFRTLDTMPGVIKINILGEGTAGNGNPNPPTPQGQKQKSEEILLGALKSGPKDRKFLEHAMVAGGKKASTLNNALSTLVKDKKVKTNGKGTYTITEKGKGA